MRKVNLNELFWFIILLGFSVYFSYLLLTGRIVYFIHPRMIKYAIISLVGITILTVYQFKKITSYNKGNKIKKGYAMFLLPLLLGFIVAPNGLNTSIADKKGISLNQFNSSGASNISDKDKNIEYLEDDTIKFNTDEYVNMMDDISTNFNKYRGKKILIDGFVYKEKSFKKNEFVVARFFLVCCAADTQIIGVMGKWKNTPSLKSGDWISVEGKIDYESSIDNDTKEKTQLPIVQIERVKKINKPDIEYVYP